jgi:hypothetical protein
MNLHANAGLSLNGRRELYRLVSRQQAAEHLRAADAHWTEAVRTFHEYPERLRRLADAANVSGRHLCSPRSPGSHGSRARTPAG